MDRWETFVLFEKYESASCVPLLPFSIQVWCFSLSDDFKCHLVSKMDLQKMEKRYEVQQGIPSYPDGKISTFFDTGSDLEIFITHFYMFSPQETVRFLIYFLPEETEQTAEDKVEMSKPVLKMASSCSLTYTMGNGRTWVKHLNLGGWSGWLKS